MSTARALGALIRVKKIDRVRQHLDEHPDHLDAWRTEPHCWLALAASVGATDIMQELVSRGHTPREAEVGADALMMGMSHDEAIRFLIQNGADVRAPGVMVSAASNASTETIELLLDHGADPWQKYGDPPRDAFEQAVRVGRPEALAALGKRQGSIATRKSILYGTMTRLLGPIVAAPALRPKGTPFGVFLATREDARAITTVGLSEVLPSHPEVMFRLSKDWAGTGSSTLASLGAQDRWQIEWWLSVVHAAVEEGRDTLTPCAVCANGGPAAPIDPAGTYFGSMSIAVGAENEPEAPSAIELIWICPLTEGELRHAQSAPQEVATRLLDAGLADLPTARVRQSVC